MDLIEPVVLADEFVRLEPLSRDHADGLRAAAADMTTAWYNTNPQADGIDDDIARRLAMRESGTMNPFVVRRILTGELAGETTLCNIDQANRHVEIGHTWLAPSTQGTEVNPAAKLLLLSHAFDTCGAIAVELRTHTHNRQSRAAIERLGAKLDGILRSHRIMPNGTLRDTAVYSILPHEWPTVRAGLTARLATFG